ncbi:transporter [Ganoderma sinense ZZ0214-1]|uniref:Transporter n=1 Tax=Ganoderma sinense ZZ0214-1 TaxID=1077348 RepID=A0A2G8RP49_9APHY|nr:transporter [Ganoderma sinense ZZ0214-1]
MHSSPPTVNGLQLILKHHLAVHYMVPIEIFEAVIDQASDDTTSLRHLSLACHAFLSRARYHLFSAVVLQTVQRVQAYSEFLGSHPWAGPLVRKLVHSSFIPMSPSHPTARMLDAIPLHLLSYLPNLITWEIGMAGIKSRSEVGAWLSCRDTTLSNYRGLSCNVRNMELAYVHFEDVSDFVELVSAFPAVQNVTCSYITIKSSMEAAQHGSETNRCDRSMQIKSLRVTTTVDIRAIQYLLDSSRTTVDNFSFTFQSLQSDEYFGRLETLVRPLSQLSSLGFVIPSGGISWDDDVGEGFLRDIGFATRIIKTVNSVGAQAMRVDFNPDPVASLGCRLSSGPQSLDVCAALEEALLTFPRPRVLAHDAVYARRTGRVEFWSATIKRAFPRLSERGFISFPESHSGTPDTAGHEATVKCLTASLDGRRVVTASNDGTIIVWNPEGGTASQEWFAHRRGVRALALSPDSQRLVSTGGRDDTLTVWDVSNGVRQAGVIEGHTESVTSCAWSPNGALIGSASADGTVRVWDAQTFEQRDLFEYPWPVDFLEHLRFSPDSRFLSWANRPLRKRGCMIWSPLSGEPAKGLFSESIGDGVHVNALSFDSESRRIAVAYAHGRAHTENVVRLWDVATGALLAQMAGHEMMLMDVSFSPDGRSVLSTSCDATAKIWDAEDGREIACLDILEFSMPAARFSPDGRYVATTSWGGAVQLWRTDDGSSVMGSNLVTVAM